MCELGCDFLNNNLQENFGFEHFKMCVFILFTKYRHYNSLLKENAVLTFGNLYIRSSVSCHI